MLAILTIETKKKAKLGNGTFKAVFIVPKDTTYRFLYLIDGVYWEDEQADRQVLNEKTGAINSVLVL